MEEGEENFSFSHMHLGAFEVMILLPFSLQLILKSGQSTSRCSIIGKQSWNVALAFGMLPTVHVKIRIIGKVREHTQGKILGNITQHAKAEPRKACC